MTGRRERETRGSKIRASQTEKRTERRRDRPRTAGSVRTPTADDSTPEGVFDDDATPGETGPGNGSSIGIDGGAFVDAESFVEPEAVRQVKRRVERWLAADRPVHLVGPVGCGKTALAVHVARERDRPVVVVNGDAELTTSDLVGEYAERRRFSVRDRYVHNVLKRSDVVRERWVDNPLTVAVREGATLVYNEFARTKPVANNVLLSVFEEGVLELPGKRGEDRYVAVHPEFRAVLTSNATEYAGVHRPQDALLDRLIGVHMDFYTFDAEVEIVAANVGAVSRATAEAVVTVIRAARGELDVAVGTRAAIMAAEGLAVTDDPDRETLVEVGVDVLASKVTDRTYFAALRETVADIIADEAVASSIEA